MPPNTIPVVSADEPNGIGPRSGIPPAAPAEKASILFASEGQNLLAWMARLSPSPTSTGNRKPVCSPPVVYETIVGNRCPSSQLGKRGALPGKVCLVTSVHRSAPC